MNHTGRQGIEVRSEKRTSMSELTTEISMRKGSDEDQPSLPSLIIDHVMSSHTFFLTTPFLRSSTLLSSCWRDLNEKVREGKDIG